MATVSLSPAPHKLGGMSNRRVPLGSVPNAANSPFRAVAAAASKRSRDQAEAQEDFSYDFQPRAKRQVLDHGRPTQRTSPRKQAVQAAEGRVFNRRPTNAPPNSFEQKLLAAAREGKLRQRAEKQEKASHEQLYDVRLWQKQTKKSFLSFVFYFESLPEDVRIRASKSIKNLGAVSLAFGMTLMHTADLCCYSSGKRSSSLRKLPMWSRHDLFPLTVIQRMRVKQLHHRPHRQARSQPISLGRLIHHYSTGTSSARGSHSRQGTNLPSKHLLANELR